MLGFLKEGPGGVYVQAGGCTRATEGVWVGIIRERALGEARGGGKQPLGGEGPVWAGEMQLLGPAICPEGLW